MPTYTWSPPADSDDLWSTATNWAIGTVTASVAPSAGDTAIISDAAVDGPGAAAVIDLDSATLAGAIQGDTIAATGVSYIGSGGASAALSAGTLVVGTPTTDVDGAWLIFRATSGGTVTGTVTSEIDLGVGQIGNGGTSANPANSLEVLEVEVGGVPADYLEVDGSQLSVSNGGSVYVGKADRSAVDLIIADGGTVDVGTSTTWLGYGTHALGLLEVDSGGTFASEGTTVLGYGTGALGELVMGDPRLQGHPAGYFVQNGGELDLGVSGTGVVGGLNPTTLVLSNGASLELGLASGGVGIVNDGVPLQVASDIDIGVAVGGTGQIGDSNGGNLLSVGGNVNVGFAGRGSLSNASGTIGTGATSSVLDIGVLQTGSGVVSLGSLQISGQTLTVNGRLVVGDKGTGQLNLQYGDDLIVTNPGGTNVSDIGAQASGVGSVFVSGATLDLSQESLTVGDAGQGTLVVNGTATPAFVGTANQGTLLVGNQAGSSGTVIVQNGASLATWSALLGVAGAAGGGTPPAASGSITVAGTATSLDVATALTVGAGGTASVTVGGLATLIAGDPSNAATNGFVRGLTIGSTGSMQVQYGGTLIVNGTATINGTLQAGLVDASGAPSVYFIDDGTGPLSTINGLMTLGDAGTVFDADTQGIAINGGTLVVQNSAFASIGLLSTSGNDALLIGNAAGPAGTLNVLNGGSLQSWAATEGVAQGAQGTALVDGAGSNWYVATTLAVGEAGSGSLTVSNGAIVIVGDPVDTDQIQALLIGDGTTGVGTVDVLSASSLEVNGGLTVGNSGTGVVTIAAGSTFTLDNFDSNYPTDDIGSAQGGSGTVLVTDAGSLLDASTTGLIVGDQGNGTLVVANSATIVVGTTIQTGMIVGNQATGSGNVAVQTGGTLTSWQDVAGQNAGAHGTISVDGTNSLYMPEVGLWLGNSGTGTLSVTNGGTVVIGDPNDTGQNQLLVLGVLGTGSGTATVSSGSTLDINGGMAIGNLGTGVATISGGSTFTLQNFDGNYPVDFIGNGSGSSGTLVVTDASTTMDASTANLIVGNQGDGTLVVENAASANVGTAIGGGVIVGNQTHSTGTLSVRSNGTLVTTSVDVGAQSTASGVATVDGSGSTLNVSGPVVIGDGGTGTAYVQNGGSFIAGQTITLGNTAGAFGTLVVTDAGSLLDASKANLTVGNLGTGTLVVKNSASIAVGTSIGGGMTVANQLAGTVTLQSGGTLTSWQDSVGQFSGAQGSITVSGTNSLYMPQVGATIGNYGTGAVSITNGGAVVVGSPSGTGQPQQLVLGAQNTGTGTVKVGSHATLDVNGGMTIGNAGTGLVTIASGAFTLANVGSSYPFSTIGSAVGSSGTLVVTDNSVMDARYESLAIGSQGDGTLVVANTAYAAIGNSIGGGIVLGQQATGTGTLSVQTGATLAVALADIGSVHGASGIGTIDGSGSSLGVSGSALIGDGGGGTVVVKNGATLSVGQGITIGNATSASGSLTLTDTGTLLDDSTGNMIVANGGTGAVTITTGAVVTVGTSDGGQLAVGENAGSKGTLVISAGTTVATAGTLYTDHATLGGVALATGSIAVTGTGALWANNGFLVAGEFGAGTLAVSNGGSVSVGADATFADVAHSAGALTVAGAGSRFSSGLTLRLGAGKGSVAVTNGGVITAEALAMGAGDTVAVDGSSSMVIGHIVGTVTGGLFIEPGAVASGAGTIAAAVADNGTIMATGGTLELTGSISGSGTLDDSGTLRLDGGVDSGLALTFDPGTLIVGSPLAMDAAISNFTTADTIEFAGNYGTVTKDFSGTTLDVFGDGSLVGAFDLGPGYDDSNVHVAESGGLVDITTDAPCFAAGTRLATPGGEVAVEALAAGDEVTTPSGAARCVTWIGRRRIDLTRHPEPARARPIRIRTDAFATGVPRRDLYLSPDHAVLLDGLLIPIRLLVNGASILRDTDCRAVTYYHVELATHDVLLAESLPAESYLDTGNRAMFENAGRLLLLHPDLTNDQARREAASCAPFAADAERVEPVWRRLAARAAQRGLVLPDQPETTSDPALRLVARGKQIRPLTSARGRYVFPLPPGVETARLVSRWFVPSEQQPWVEDRRRLGVMVRRLTRRVGAAVEPIALDHPALGDGWWQTERAGMRMWRWTDGDAMLALPGGANDSVLLEVELTPGTAYALSASAPRASTLRMAG